MICRRAGAGVDGGGKETTTKGAEEKETVGWRVMGDNGFGEKVVATMKQPMVMVVASDGII